MSRTKKSILIIRCFTVSLSTQCCSLGEHETAAERPNLQLKKDIRALARLLVRGFKLDDTDQQRLDEATLATLKEAAQKIDALRKKELEYAPKGQEHVTIIRITKPNRMKKFRLQGSQPALRSYWTISFPFDALNNTFFLKTPSWGKPRKNGHLHDEEKPDEKFHAEDSSGFYRIDEDTGENYIALKPRYVDYFLALQKQRVHDDPFIDPNAPMFNEEGLTNMLFGYYDDPDPRKRIDRTYNRQVVEQDDTTHVDYGWVIPPSTSVLTSLRNGLSNGLQFVLGILS
jgi:hypothetical protein